MAPHVIEALEKASQFLSIGHYSPHTCRVYLSELRYVFMYYHDVDPHDYTEDMMFGYLLYLVRTLKCSRVKCKSAAQSVGSPFSVRFKSRI